MVDEASLRWKQFGERTLYESKWVRLTMVDIQAPNGQRWEHHAVRLKTVATALVVNEQQKVLMMWRHRFIPDSFGWELPGGIVDLGETGAETVVREVEEETGWRPMGEPILVSSFEPMPGLVQSLHEVYLLRGAQHIGEPTDTEEAARIKWLSMQEVQTNISDGKIAGSGPMVGLLYLLANRDFAFEF